MISIRKAHERGHADHGWLKTFHTFSFADYHDPRHMHWSALRVINEDFVAPGQGFGTHPHKDMEILTYILEGQLEHKDSLGTGSVITPGEVQRMSAGTGVTHSEYNPSPSEPVHLLQIWILPEKKGIKPGYEQKRFDPKMLENRFRLIASRDGRDGSVIIHQDASVHAAILTPGEKISLPLNLERKAWLQIARGSLTYAGHSLQAGDGAGIQEESTLELTGKEKSEMLLFDLP